MIWAMITATLKKEHMPHVDTGSKSSNRRIGAIYKKNKKTIANAIVTLSRVE